MALHSQVVQNASELEIWSAAWGELLRRSACDEPTRSPIWLFAWWRVFGGLEGRKLRLTLFFDGDRLVGIAPLLCRKKWHFSAVPFERLELLGSGEAEADEVCSDHLGLIAERDHEAAVAEALVRDLVLGALGPWDELVLPGLDADDATLPALEHAFESAGIAVERTITGACPYVALPKTFDDYLGILRSEQRYLVRRSLRDFERWAAGESELHRVSERSELEAGKRILETLHRERWSAQGRAGVFESRRFRAFHDDVMAALLDASALDLTWLSVRGRPIAAAYSLVWNGKVRFYQSGRTLDVPKGIRPGIVLHALAIRHAIERGLREYDFLGGTSQYKLELATATRPIARLRAVRSRLKEGVRGAAERGIARVKRFREAMRSALPGRLAEARAEPR